MTKPFPKAILFGIPEGGIHILNEVVLGMPLLHSGIWLNQWSDDVYENLNNLEPGEIRAGYFFYSENLKRFMDEHEIRRIFICRDPRDMILAYLDLVMSKDNKHVHHEYFSEHLTTTEERLQVLITGFNETREIAGQYGLDAIGYGNIKHHYIPYLGWMHDHGTCVVRYEDLVNDETKLHAEMDRLVRYVWGELSESGMSREDYLHRFYQTQFSSTFTQASSEQWKQHFTAELKQKFKEVAGELLIYLGYEHDLDW